MKAMSKPEFIAYWLATDECGRNMLDYCEENLAERQAEYAGECARFGDAGPGQGLVIRELRTEIIGARRRLQQFGALS